VGSFKNAQGKRPNASPSYDGMHLIFEALKKIGGKADGDAMIAT
jgi:branched-chain amino acid transport system substrate-binding protein